jgi:hypothetical protein
LIRSLEFFNEIYFLVQLSSVKNLQTQPAWKRRLIDEGFSLFYTPSPLSPFLIAKFLPNFCKKIKVAKRENKKNEEREEER